MPQLSAMPFREFTFSEDEICVAAVFTELQTMYLETQLARAVQERANLSVEPDTANYKEKFLMEMEHLRGQIETYQFLLSTSENLVARQRELLLEQIDKQAQE